MCIYHYNNFYHLWTSLTIDIFALLATINNEHNLILQQYY